MNLCVDIGNTCVKLAFFGDKKMSGFQRFAESDSGLFFDFLKNKGVNRAIVSSVTELPSGWIQKLGGFIPFVMEFTTHSKIPVKNLYQTASTLGADRLPTVIAASEACPGSDVLVIDAGTCIKYNFMNRGGEYLGGAISPGIQMRFRALHTFTSRLPLIEPEPCFDKFIGGSTRECILSGVQMACLGEMREFIRLYQEQYPGLKVFLTGGDQAFFEKRLKNCIFADPYLVLKGLNSILNFNT
jgi:type III pantothenate kinase